MRGITAGICLAVLPLALGSIARAQYLIGAPRQNRWYGDRTCHRSYHHRSPRGYAHRTRCSLKDLR